MEYAELEDIRLRITTLEMRAYRRELEEIKDRLNRLEAGAVMTIQTRINEDTDEMQTQALSLEPHYLDGTK